MFDDLIINDSFDIIKFLNKLNLDLSYTWPQLKHIIVIVIAMVIKDFNRKLSDINELTNPHHYTRIGKFLNTSPWHKKDYSLSLYLFHFFKVNH
ncbi:MAG: transposase [Clostridia bacterium]|jgi:hypothetical protein|nr:transposase [Clostridia bacterium]